MVQSGAKKGLKKPTLEEVIHAKVSRGQKSGSTAYPVCIHVQVICTLYNVHVYMYTCIISFIQVCHFTCTCTCTVCGYHVQYHVQYSCSMYSMWLPCTESYTPLHQSHSHTVSGLPPIPPFPHSPMQSAPFHPPVFGAALEEVMELQAESHPELTIPWVVAALCDVVLSLKGPQTEGIFR